jgi:hypothetical protein
MTTKQPYFNTIGGIAFNDYSLSEFQPLEPNIKVVSNITTKNNPDISFGSKNSKSYNTQLTGNYLYNDTMNNNNKDYSSSH